MMGLENNREVMMLGWGRGDCSGRAVGLLAFHMEVYEKRDFTVSICKANISTALIEI